MEKLDWVVQSATVCALRFIHTVAATAMERTAVAITMWTPQPVAMTFIFAIAIAVMNCYWTHSWWHQQWHKKMLLSSQCELTLSVRITLRLRAMDFSHGRLPISLPQSHLIHSAVSWQTVLSLRVFNCYWLFIDSYLQRNFTAACFADRKSPVNSLEIVKKCVNIERLCPLRIVPPQYTAAFFSLCVFEFLADPIRSSWNYFQTERFSFIKILWFGK